MAPQRAQSDERIGESGGHLDVLQLDAVRAGEGTRAEIAHVRACETCRGELEGLQGLAAEVSQASGPYIAVPGGIDAVVMAHARAARMRVLRPRGLARHWPWLVATAAAAMLLLAVGVVWLTWRTGRPAAGPQAVEENRGHKSKVYVPGFPPADIDGSGTVDILDAFTLARHLEKPQPVNLAWDLTGDGTVDHDDVDAVATVAVSLEGRQG